MITAAQIAALRSQDEATESLKARLAQIRRERQPLCLGEDEFKEILKWKLVQQIGRQRARREGNTEKIIRDVTGLALTITHEDKGYELELRVGLLCTLRGVAVPVASSVLALVFPDEYAVIDYRGWRQVFGEVRKTFSIADYKRYMDKIRPLAEELDWPIQDIDHAIWEYDKRNDGQVQHAAEAK